MPDYFFKSLILILLLSGCVSVPIGSIIKLASMDNSDLLRIKAEHVRTKITINEPATLQTKNVKLVLKFDYSGLKKSEYQFILNLIDDRKIVDSSSWFSSALNRNIYEFKIADESFDEFQKYQKELIEFGKPKRYYWTVYYYLKSRPPQGESLNLDLELKLRDSENYFYLLKSAELNIN